MKRVGVLGGGQLGRMLGQAAAKIEDCEIQVRCWDEHADACAGQVTELIAGEWDDADALNAFCQGLDVATFEFENVPAAVLRSVSERVELRPGVRSLEMTADRLVEKHFLELCGLSVAPYRQVDSRDDLDLALQEIGLPCVLKTRRFGYDGKGQWLLRSANDVDRAPRDLPGAILEGFVEFDREVSIVAARGDDGSIAYYPLTENEHRDGILHRSVAPAPDITEAMQTSARRHVLAVMESLGHIGVLTIEFFVKGDALIANEIAPRVHNSGHWTIDGAHTSQFANHLRAITGLPLGSADMLAPTEMLNIIGGPPDRLPANADGVHVHMYGKQPRPGRKIGHITTVRGA